MPHAQQPIDLTTTLRLQSLFKAAQLFGASKQRCSKPESGRTREAADAARQQLHKLMNALDLAAGTAVQDLAHLEGAAARAVENITDWMAYLPTSCVKAMVNDGWHWST
jgi:hypothetical protein